MEAMQFQEARLRCTLISTMPMRQTGFGSSKCRQIICWCKDIAVRLRAILGLIWQPSQAVPLLFGHVGPNLPVFVHNLVIPSTLGHYKYFRLTVVRCIPF